MVVAITKEKQLADNFGVVFVTKKAAMVKNNNKSNNNK